MSFKNKIVIFKTKETFIDRLILLFRPNHSNVGYFVSEKCFVSAMCFDGIFLRKLNPEHCFDITVLEEDTSQGFFVDHEKMSEFMMSRIGKRYSIFSEVSSFVLSKIKSQFLLEKINFNWKSAELVSVGLLISGLPISQKNHSLVTPEDFLKSEVLRKVKF